MMEFRCVKSIISNISLLITMGLCSVQSIACLGNDGGNDPYIEPEPVEGYVWEWVQDVVPENIPYWVDGSHWECVMLIVGHQEDAGCQVGQACDDSGDGATDLGLPDDPEADYYEQLDAIRPPAPPYTPQQCAQDRIGDHAACRKDAYSKYTDSMTTCGGSTIGGSIVGGGAGVTLVFLSGPYGWIAYTIGAVGVGGTGVAAWGGLSCPAEKENTRERELSECDTKKELDLLACAAL